MAGFSSLGIGSGLDTATMLEQIKAGEQTRLKPYSLLKASYQGKVSAWGKISSALSALQGGVTSLKENAFTTLNVGTNKAFTVKADKDASADTHSVHVEQLAKAHKLKTGEYADADLTLGDENGEGTRTLTITNAAGKELSIELQDDETSLKQIAQKINKEKGDFSASVQRVDDKYQLVVSSKTTGSDGKMTIAVEGDDKLSTVLNNDMSEVSAAEDAILTVDGTTFTRSSNNISDIITGITFELKAVTEGDDAEQLTLTQDNSAIKTNLKAFVEHYNTLLKQTSAASKYVQNNSSGLKDEDVSLQNSENGALMGDSTLRGMVSEIREAVNGIYGDSTSDYSGLADIGIKIDATTGQMTLDENTLDQAIADSPDAVADMFLGRESEEGIASVLGGIITEYVGDSSEKIDGVIKEATKGLDEQGKLMQEQIDKTQKLIDSTVERYRTQFVALENTMSQLGSMSNQLSALISSM